MIEKILFCGGIILGIAVIVAWINGLETMREVKKRERKKEENGRQI
jgi:hypothetical protein